MRLEMAAGPGVLDEVQGALDTFWSLHDEVPTRVRLEVGIEPSLLEPSTHRSEIAVLVGEEHKVPVAQIHRVGGGSEYVLIVTDRGAGLGQGGSFPAAVVSREEGKNRNSTGVQHLAKRKHARKIAPIRQVAGGNDEGRRVRGGDPVEVLLQHSARHLGALVSCIEMRVGDVSEG